MSTEKQRKAVENIVENRGNISKAMRDAGYTDATAKNPKNLTESKGFEELCKNVGLTDDFILSCLAEDINAKPKNRYQELSLASKIRGLLIDRKDITSGGKPIYLPSELIEKETEIDVTE